MFFCRHVFLSVDFSNYETYIVANLTLDKNLIGSLLNTNVVVDVGKHLFPLLEKAGENRYY